MSTAWVSSEAESQAVHDEASSLLRRPAPLECEAEQLSQRIQPRWRRFADAIRSTVSPEALTRRCQPLCAKYKISLLILGGLSLTAGFYALVAGTWSNATSSADIRVALLADAHLIGPQYKCCSESNDVDNDSIMKTVDRLQEAQRQINSLSPSPSAVVFLGDVIHNGYYSHDFNWYLANRNAYTVGSEVFQHFSAPVHFLWGNHDYHTVCGNSTASHDRAGLSHRLFRHFLGPTALPYSSRRLGRYLLIFLNAMLGPSWDSAHPRCDTSQASLGAEQLAWLRRQLAGGAPAFVFLHRPLPATMRNEAPALAPLSDVLSVLLAHRSSVMAVFSGHYHRGLNWSSAYPFPHITLPACRYDHDNWFLLSLPQRGPIRSWRLLDWAKNKGGARCSETWTYPATSATIATTSATTQQGSEQQGHEPGPVQPQPPETGSCGSPTLAEVGTVELPALQDASEVPGPTGHQFNPEPPCCLTYQRAFLQRCLDEGPTAACCSILGQHLRPSSAAYGASCMCWPPFWKQAHETFHEVGRNLSQVLDACVANHGWSLQWAGRPGGACLKPGSWELPPPPPPLDAAGAAAAAGDDNGA
ncbi:hypothetical protein Agub_g12447 [Astrephomene gubernaculifera]|uniref:Calcineurin-like phosphoesterase domain-containing protein n=1 Tax=Astrephomene gubernaculifera TaxID=47775 RepID=A0AAD3DY91_9CHLO|nr:hypothetical protein Agub_g12447 [Astrephomene gubernaculifera]